MVLYAKATKIKTVRITHSEEFRITNIVPGATNLYLILKLFTALMQTLQSDDNEILLFLMYVFVCAFVCVFFLYLVSD